MARRNTSGVQVEFVSLGRGELVIMHSSDGHI